MDTKSEVPKDDYLCIGDHVCLFCEDSMGYIFSEQSNAEGNFLYAFTNQDISQPGMIANPQVSTFRICVQNRYKLSKRYKKLLAQLDKTPSDEDLLSQVDESKRDAEAEDQDNDSEQHRLHGKVLKYGDIVQLQHTFSAKFIHCCPKKPSQRESGNFLVYLDESNGKTSQFKILPKYKLSSEGEDVCSGDHIVLESIKSGGQFIHTTRPFTFYNRMDRCEVNCSVDKSEFTIVKRFQTRDYGGEFNKGLWGGAVVQLHHKHLEAYCCAKGVVEHPKTDSVHLHVVEADLMQPETLYAPQTSTSFWQLLPEFSVLDGEPLHWGGQIRMQHITSQHFLLVNADGDVRLSDNGQDPRTVFRLHHMQRNVQNHKSRSATLHAYGYVEDKEYTRIEHVISGRWLHGIKDECFLMHEGESSVFICQLSTSADMLYYDAFSMYRIGLDQLQEVNFVMGTLPVISCAMYEMKSNNDLEDDLALQLSMTLTELKRFLSDPAPPLRQKTRRALMRELQIIDELITMLQLVATEEFNGEVPEVVHSISELLKACIHKDINNCLYVAKFMDFFQSNFSMKSKNPIATYILQITLVLVKDRRQVVDTITPKQIDKMVFYLRKYQHYRYIQLLSTVCKCNNKGIPENQCYIANQIFSSKKKYLYGFVNFGGKVCLSLKDESEDPVPIASFLQGVGTVYGEEDRRFLEEELKFLTNLCHGRNQFCIDLLTKNQAFITWDVSFGVLQSEDIPDDIKALFCRLITKLYVDASENISIVKNSSSTYLYNKLTMDKTPSGWLDQQAQYVDDSLDIKVPDIQNWLKHFFMENVDLESSNHKLNALRHAALELLCHLVEFGYYCMEKLSDILPCILELLRNLSGKQLFSDGQGDSVTMVTDQKFNSENTRTLRILIEIKYKSLEILELAMRFESMYQAEMLVATFKDIEQKLCTNPRQKNILGDLLDVSRKPVSLFRISPKSELKKLLERLISMSTFNEKDLLHILMDSALYVPIKMDDQVDSLSDRYNKIVNKALWLCAYRVTKRTRLLKHCEHSLVLMHDTSCEVLKDVQTFLPLLQQLVPERNKDKQCQIICAILEKFKKCCEQTIADTRFPNTTGQNILVNQGILSVLMQLLQGKSPHQKSDIDDKKEKQIMDEASAHHGLVVRQTLELLCLLCCANARVQGYLYDHVDVLLGVEVAHPTLAETLIQMFKNNSAVCKKVDFTNIKKIANLAAVHQRKAPNFVQVLKQLIQPKEGGEVSSRIQYIFARLGTDIFGHQGLVLLNRHKGDIKAILTGQMGKELLSYYVNIANIVALTAKDMKATVQYFCSSLFSVRDILDILSHDQIQNNIKRPFLKLLHWLLLPQSPNVLRKRSFWNFMQLLAKNFDECQKFASANEMPPITSIEDCFVYSSEADQPTIHKGSVYFFLDAVLPFLKTFGSSNVMREKEYPKEFKIYRHIVTKCMTLLPVVAAFMSNKTMHRSMVHSLKSVMETCGYGDGAIADILHVMDSNFGMRCPELILPDQDNPIWKKEEILNNKLKNFVENSQRLLKPENTIGRQLGCTERKFMNQIYTEVGSGKELPLTEDFQKHVSSYVCIQYMSPDRRYHKAVALLNHLKIAASVVDTDSSQTNRLTGNCLQILRALLHNLIVRLPPDLLTSKKRKKKYILRLEHLEQLQHFFLGQGLTELLLKLIGSKDPSIFRECLAIMECMLYGANEKVQDAALEVFQSTREESLFMIFQDFLKTSTNFAKERRYVENKHASKKKNKPQKLEQKPKTWIYALFTPAKHLRKIGIEKTNDEKTCHSKSPSAQDEEELEEYSQSESIQINTSTVQLILNVVAKLSDGQHRGLQDYMRDQPDNLRTYNIVAAVTQYLSILYTHIKPENVDLAIDVFDTLAELCLGNQENKLVVLDNKIVDYVNFILKQDLSACSTKQWLHLMKCISNLLTAMIEESSPNSLKIAKDIARTLALTAVMETIQTCYNLQQDSPFMRHVNRLSREYTKQKATVELIDRVGHRFFIIFARVTDLLPPDKNPMKQKSCAKYNKAMLFYRQGVQSVEIIKDDFLQKVYFPVSKGTEIRHDLKVKLKWNIDRSSQANKIRDFQQWTDLIIEDFFYQEKIRANFISSFIAKNWKLWNYLIILVSLVINILMLVTWVAPLSIEEIPANATRIPAELYNSMPVFTIEAAEYNLILRIFAIIHHVVAALLMISYFLSQHPSPPKCTDLCGPLSLVKNKRQKEIDAMAKKPKREKTAEHFKPKLFSPRSFYYVVLLFGLSILGSVTSGYCFAFHLLHIVEVNTLLNGVIRAITTNGKSLLWVAILGFIALYIYALVGFAFFRPSFGRDSQYYCKTLYQCSLTIATYGLIGTINEIKRNPMESTFVDFLGMAAFQITFFIFFTTIGLNIIFGIIVDTFSELRDLKWRAENDMQDVCFICGLPNYDFEHHAKGFYHHTHYEHNMWTYVYYFIYLTNTNHSEYTALDFYVAKQRKEEKMDFYPVNRALSLSNLEEEKVDKMEELKKDLTFLKNRQQQTDIEWQMKAQNKDQKQWRRTIYRHHPSIADMAESFALGTVAEQPQDDADRPQGTESSQPTSS